MTLQERELLEARYLSATRPLEFTPHPDPKFTYLVARPCPFVSDQGQCLVYDIRPYNCRRWMCGRVDPAQESLEIGGPMGCWNLSDRVDTSLRFQEHVATNERHHAAWAKRHGWSR